METDGTCDLLFRNIICIKNIFVILQLTIMILTVQVEIHICNAAIIELDPLRRLPLFDTTCRSAEFSTFLLKFFCLNSFMPPQHSTKTELKVKCFS